MTEDRLPLTSQDVLADKLAALRELFPGIFAEGKVDFERLKQALGESVDQGRERYGLSWAGKSEAIRNLQAQSVGTLNPVPEESVNFETTENIFIEGDNLEVLKLLQKSYYNQIKMIYIDPPYNTGKEFIYPDNFREGLEDYLRYSGQKNGEGIKLTTNTETDGRFQSKWLNMMYPRLFLARNLLRDDGVIFISIDDNEVSNLRKLCDDIFGEENFIESFIWQKKKGGGNDSVHTATEHEYILLFSKSKINLPNLYHNYSQEYLKRYKEEDEQGNFFWDTFKRKSGKQYYPITCPDGVILEYDESGNKISWLRSEQRFKDDLQKGEIRIININGSWSVQFKQRQPIGKKPRSILLEYGTTSDGSKEILNFFNKNIFDNSKPSQIIKHFLETGINTKDIILDFFAGSSTTAHAVLELNKEDNNNRKFIMVQLPEACDENSEAFKAGYKTIADIGKERIRRAINKINEEENGKLDLNGSAQQDRGFKVFKLTESNFKIWDGTAPKDTEQLELLLREFADNIRPGTTKLGMLYEILLKAGFSLTAKVETLDIAGQEIYAIEDRELFLCLESEILEETVRQILTYQPNPKQFISLDSSFRGNDQLKTNTQLQMRDHDIKFRTV